MATSVLCYTCYRAEQRTKARGGASLMRALNRQPAALIRAYRGLMIAAATLDAAENGCSGLAPWIAECVEPLVDSIQDYIIGQPELQLESVPKPSKRFKAFHEITVSLMRLGAGKEMIQEIQGRVKVRLAELAARSESENRSSRSRFRQGGVVRFRRRPGKFP